jgi:hypothetical protein
VQARRGERQTMAAQKPQTQFGQNVRLLPNSTKYRVSSFLIFISSELSVQFASNALLRTTKTYEFKFASNNYGLS